MSSSRPKLTLDEQSFQDMLAAAFTIQEHNAKRKRALQPKPFCGQCGAPVQEGEQLCGQCAGEQFRPGEQMQRKWASLWLMSQEQGVFPDRSADGHDGERPEAAVLRVPEAVEIPAPETESAAVAEEEADADWPGAALMDLRQSAPPLDVEPEVKPALAESDGEQAAPVRWNFRELRLKLRFHRADLYLVVAIIVSTFAMLWVLSATPTPGAQRKPRLQLWERALISLGLAEAPEPPAQRGNPAAQVWVDPRAALYYCQGEEQYGKTPGGHVTTQGEAQLDQFEPAGRAACD
jgi:predicted nucleic acid-binding Zn ribbon protein